MSRRGAQLICLLLALGLLAQAGWIHAKAELAQWLLQRAWDEARSAEAVARPWPWADTWPVARLRAPRQQVEQIVLHGDDGRALAFGPGWAPASTAPGDTGTIVLSGHRDTHFAWLQGLRVGDSLALESPAGVRHYRVTQTQISDSRQAAIALEQTDRLLLVTCWPFDAVISGGPMRYVVTAEAESAPPAKAQRTRATSARIREITSA